MEELIQGVLGYLVQGFGNSPTQISKFLGFGELYGQTVPRTDQLCTRGLVHIQEDIKLYILSGGRFFLRGFGIVGAGVGSLPIGISKFLAGKPTSEGNQARHRQDRDMRVGAY